MRLKYSYKKLNRTLLNRSREPAWEWGFRAAVTLTPPLIWGVVTGNSEAAIWMALAGECVAFIDLKGNVGQRFRLLLSAAALSTLFCVAGSLAGNFLWLNLLGMLLVGFVSGLFKNLGDRGVSLALSVYLFYILTSSHPLSWDGALADRVGWVAIGSGWAVSTGVISFLFIRAGTPYRESIAVIWKAVAELAETAGRGWDGQSKKSGIREIYLKEKAVRDALDGSIYLFEETTEKAGKVPQYELPQARKTTSIVSLYLIQLSDTAEQLGPFQLSRRFALQIHSLFRTLQQIGERMEIYMLAQRDEEKTILLSRLARLDKILHVLASMPENEQPGLQQLVERIRLLSNRIQKLVRHALQLMDAGDEPRVITAYSFTQTLNILHPKYLKSNLSRLLNFNSFTTRYALRIGIATMIGALIAGFLFPDHGYWIIFTVIVVSQPYSGATLKKGLERCAGTVVGILAGTGILQLPFPQFARLLLVFTSTVLLIYFLRKSYSIATFFITLMLVGLLSIEPAFDENLLMIRIIGTLIGSLLAITAGFLLLPHRDKIELPRLMASALLANAAYFRNTFYSNWNAPWTRLKRKAETGNSNAFDAYLRFLKEPGRKRKDNREDFFYLLTHNVRITRELNNFNNDRELEEEKIPIRDKEKYEQMLHECDDLFRENLQLMKRTVYPHLDNSYAHTFPEQGLQTHTPTEAQLVYVGKLLLELEFFRDGLLQRAKRLKRSGHGAVSGQVNEQVNGQESRQESGQESDDSLSDPATREEKHP